VGFLIRFLVIVAVIVAIAAVPLFMLQRSKCPSEKREGKTDTEYNWVWPWDDPPPECRSHRKGFDIVRDEIGL
jgi:hypothetical protein